MARPAVIIAKPRSGSTYLSYGLDGHPDVFWPRHEALGWIGTGCECLSQRVDALRLIHRAQQYDVAGVKIIYRRIMRRESDRMMNYLRDAQVHAIWLYRDDVIAQVLSSRLKVHRKRDGEPAHYRSSGDRPSYELSPGHVVKGVLRERQWKVRILEGASKAEFPSLVLRYEDIKGEDRSTALPADVSSRICEFLGVRDWVLETHMHRACIGGHRKYIENWPDVERALREAGYL